jgi:ribose 5-phosphate isomerase RpiB
MRVGNAADHGWFNLKQEVAESLRGLEYDMIDFGAHQLDSSDDYPDFIISSQGPSQQERSAARSVTTSDVTVELRNCGTRTCNSVIKAQKHPSYGG